MSVWEYHIVRTSRGVNIHQERDVLDGEGAKGWELVSVVVDAGGNTYMYMKRRRGVLARFRAWFAWLRRKP
jgi:hypothetical protein